MLLSLGVTREKGSVGANTLGLIWQTRRRRERGREIWSERNRNCFHQVHEMCQCNTKIQHDFALIKSHLFEVTQFHSATAPT